MVFDISSKSFQILFFQFPFLPGNDNKHWKERRKIFGIEFLKELLMQKRNLNWKSIIYILDRRNVSREFQFFKLQQKVSDFSQAKDMGSDGIFCHFMLNFCLFGLQIVFKARQQWLFNIIHLQRLLLQTVSNRNSFYGLSTVTDDGGGPCDWSRLRRDRYRVLLCLDQSGWINV